MPSEETKIFVETDDRYLALGIRSGGGGGGSIGGDVIVGWIYARSGQGGVDDYFLASPADDTDGEKCDDGAESCPDTAKDVSKFNFLQEFVF